MKHRHSWNKNPPEPNETFCTECGNLYSGKGRPRKNSPPMIGTAPKDVSSIIQNIANDMAGMDSAHVTSSGPSTSTGHVLNPGAMDGAVDGSVPAALQPVIPPMWCKMAGRQISQAYVLLVTGGLRRFAGREAKEPEEDNVEELGAALGEQLAIWFPDSELTPLARAGIAAAAIGATMVVGSTPIKPTARSVGIPSSTEDVALSDEPIQANAPAGSTAVKLPNSLL